MERASLTGESVPLPVTLESTEEKPEEAKNVVFNTSLCMQGELIGVVFATGDKSLIGRIARLATVTQVVETPLQREIKLFVRRLFVFATLLGATFFIISVSRGQYSVLLAIVNVFVIVLVACVPQGLPMTVRFCFDTLRLCEWWLIDTCVVLSTQVFSCLSVTAQRMAAQNVWVKQLHSVEALGSATVIASDKTGTLTMNKMSASHVWYDDQLLNHESISPIFALLPVPDSARGGPPSATFSESFGPSTLQWLLKVAALCNRAHFEGEVPLSDEEVRLLEGAQELRHLDPTMSLSAAKASNPGSLARFDSFMAHAAAASPMHRPPRMNVAQALETLQKHYNDQSRPIVGDSSDKAFFQFTNKLMAVALLRHRNPVVFEVPFSSKTKFSGCIVRRNFGFRQRLDGPDTSEQRMYLAKGAPEVILAQCTHWMNQGQRTPITEDFMASYQQAYESMGALGNWDSTNSLTLRVCVSQRSWCRLQVSASWALPRVSWMRKSTAVLWIPSTIWRRRTTRKLGSPSSA